MAAFQILKMHESLQGLCSVGAWHTTPIHPLYNFFWAKQSPKKFAAMSIDVGQFLATSTSTEQFAAHSVENEKI